MVYDHNTVYSLTFFPDTSNSGISCKFFVMTEVIVPKYMAKKVIPKKIQKTAKKRAPALDGVLSPYLEKG